MDFLGVDIAGSLLMISSLVLLFKDWIIFCLMSFCLGRSFGKPQHVHQIPIHLTALRFLHFGREVKWRKLSCYCLPFHNPTNCLDPSAMWWWIPEFLFLSFCRRFCRCRNHRSLFHESRIVPERRFNHCHPCGVCVCVSACARLSIHTVLSLFSQSNLQFMHRHNGLIHFNEVVMIFHVINKCIWDIIFTACHQSVCPHSECVPGQCLRIEKSLFLHSPKRFVRFHCAIFPLLGQLSIICCKEIPVGC